MQHLKHLLKRHISHNLRPISKSLIIFLIVVAAIGFADATYLTIEHFTNANPPCFIGSCELVLNSTYATVAGIPVAIFGVVYYLFILMAFVVYLESKKEKELALRVGCLSTVIGLGSSLYFFILQAFVLHAFCQYCLVSAGTSTILFVTASYIIVTSRKHQPVLM